MIDVETDVFDYVYQDVSALVPTGCFKSVYVPSPPAFPFATLIEADNVTDARRRSTSSSEEYAILTYEANVYDTDKATCRTVMNALDAAMIRLGFVRTMTQFVPNLADPTLFRYMARYRGEADGRKVIYKYQ